MFKTVYQYISNLLYLFALPSLISKLFQILPYLFHTLMYLFSIVPVYLV